MLEMRLTSKEIDFLLYVSRFQDDNGNVAGVHYREVCEAMHMSYQGFYDVKKSLVEKGFIESTKSNRIDHDIKIIDNAFLSQEDINAGYVNTNKEIFRNEDFYKMKAGAKLLALQFIKVSRSNRGQYKIGKNTFYEKYTSMLGVDRRAIRVYLMQLRKFFSIGIKDGMYYMRPKVAGLTAGHVFESDNFNDHNVEVMCRRNKIKNPEKKSLKDVSGLIKQYKKMALEVHKDIIGVLNQAIEKSIEQLNINEKTLRIRELKPKLIHKILKEELVA